MDVFTLCFSEKLPAAGNLAFILEGNDLIWNGQCFPPQIQRAGLTTVHVTKWDPHLNPLFDLLFDPLLDLVLDSLLDCVLLDPFIGRPGRSYLIIHILLLVIIQQLILGFKTINKCWIWRSPTKLKIKKLSWNLKLSFKGDPELGLAIIEDAK